MKRFAIVTALLALAGFGFVSSAWAGGGPPSTYLDCGDKDYVCAQGYDWEIWYQCSSEWENAYYHSTWYNLYNENAALNAKETNGGYGDCRMSMTNLEGDDDVAVYSVGCSLPTAKKRGQGGGRNVSLTIRNLGPAECSPP